MEDAVKSSGGRRRKESLCGGSGRESLQALHSYRKGGYNFISFCFSRGHKFPQAYILWQASHFSCAPNTIKVVLG